MVISTFADRLWWARHRAGLGATRLARLVQCSQSLISSLERNNAEKSKLNNKFADALNVDPTWLAYGVEERAPTGFNPDEARQGRENMARGAQKDGVNVIRLPQPGVLSEPRWATEGEPAPLSPLTGADALQKTLVANFMDYARLAGAERTAMFLSTLDHIAKLVSFEQAERENQARVANERHERADE